MNSPQMGRRVVRQRSILDGTPWKDFDFLSPSDRKKTLTNSKRA
ncbi:hypothetical protein [Leptospira ainazelensis]|nr:hypothetical protein [Leptospira ainazelensis]